MFTGIIEEVGSVTALANAGDHARLTIGCSTVLGDARTGDSIAVNGVCLTVTAQEHGAFSADLMAETMRATSLSDLAVGSSVNLERAVAAGSRLGGHLVQGHVDGVGTILDREDEPGTTTVTVGLPDGLARYVVAKGSITVQGASLTVMAVAHDGTSFALGLIPHTLEVTTFASLAVGDRVNLEVDVIAKYVERLLAAGTASPYPPTTSPEDPA